MLIAHDILAKIKSQQYPVGTYLPSESQLTQLYGVARETIRKALQQLANLGIIQPIKGKGSLILDYTRYNLPLSGITSFQELNQIQDMHAQTRVLENHPGQIPTYFAQHGVNPQEEVIVLQRLRRINGQAIVLDQDYLLTSLVPQVPERAAQNSLYEYLEGQLGYEIAYATKEVTVETPTDRQRELLQLAVQDTVVVVRSLTYLADATLIQLTESYHRPQTFKFVDFARRTKI
ncbi:trehalose operon repressor [Bombilactobacillus apium]|uniref:trehalose operon repressor n=1 Tax=Bombilactobacillus apium TaxID=2675299 RepID=UPI0018928B0B|nr:trehalose operon repressor [Bombilactobacillus apium]